jgi:hypothetical protein
MKTSLRLELTFLGSFVFMLAACSTRTDFERAFSDICEKSPHMHGANCSCTAKYLDRTLNEKQRKILLSPIGYADADFGNGGLAERGKALEWQMIGIQTMQAVQKCTANPRAFEDLEGSEDTSLNGKKSAYKEPKLTESVIRSPDTRLGDTFGSIRGRLEVFHNRYSGLAWVALGSEVIFSTESDWGLEASQIKSPGNRTGDYSHQYYRFSSSAGNVCEGPHFVVEITKKDIAVHKIDTCDYWGHVADHLLFSDGKVLYNKSSKDGQ